MASSINERSQAPDLPQRWTIGVDKRRVGAFVGLALIAGFAFGFMTARHLARNGNDNIAGLGRAEASMREDLATEEAVRYNRVTRVVSADTVEIEGVGVVRMLGIETPDGKSPREIYETHGRQARAFAEKSLVGKDVRVETDDSTGAQEAPTQVSGYIFTRDGLLFNGEMVRAGYAFVETVRPFRMIEQFRALEREAMQGLRGVWGPAAQQPATSLAAAQPSPSPASSPVPADGKAKKLAPLLPSEVGPNLPAVSGAAVSPAPGEQQYFVSPSDRMYHKASCESLSKKRRALSIGEARADGFTACSRCFASTLLKAP